MLELIQPIANQDDRTDGKYSDKHFDKLRVFGLENNEEIPQTDAIVKWEVLFWEKLATSR